MNAAVAAALEARRAELQVRYGGDDLLTFPQPRPSSTSLGTYASHPWVMQAAAELPARVADLEARIVDDAVASR